MTIKTLSIANVNIGSKPDFPNGLTVSSGNVGIGTRTASYPLDVQSAASGASTAQRLLVNSSLFTFASGTVTVNTAAKTGTLTITSAETYTLSLIYSGMILTATAGTGNLGTMVAGTYVTVTGTSVNGSSQLVISYSYPGGTDPVAGNVTAINVSGYVAGWGASLLFTGGGASVDLASISGLVGTSNSNTDGYLAFNTRSSGSLAERMRITASGNVGIGTTSPSEKLFVLDGNFAISKTSYGGFLKWTQGSASPKAGGWEWGDGTGWRMDFGPSATPRLSIYDNGNVGIGTTSPGTTLDVNGSTFVTGLLSVSPSGITKDNGYSGSFVSTKSAASGQHINLIRSATSVWSIGFVYNTSTFAIGNGQTTDSSFTNPVFNITTSNNVGIGTVSPAATLHTSGTVAITTATSGTANSVILASANYALPDATTCSGRIYWVKNTSASAITMTSGGGTIDGVAAATGISLAQYDCYTVVSNGINWYII